MPRARTLPDNVVLERAMSVFWKQGYAGTSLRNLTQATGLSIAALLNRFKDKDGLFLAVLQQYAERGLTDRLSRLSSMDDPLVAIVTFFDELVALTIADRDQRGCLLVNTVLDGAATSASCRQLVQSRFAEVEKFFAGRLRRARTENRLPPDININATATSLLGAVFAIRVMARLDHDSKRLKAISSNALAPLYAQP
jgi:TetR/AcrR family transcriptional regulator, transcriptional repressor for nem operon